jgi:hypothetical protein
MVGALMMDSRRIQVGDAVEIRSHVALDTGSFIPKYHVAQVVGYKVIDGTPVVQISAATGTLHWIAASNTRPAR